MNDHHSDHTTKCLHVTNVKLRIPATRVYHSSVFFRNIKAVLMGFVFKASIRIFSFRFFDYDLAKHMRISCEVFTSCLEILRGKEKLLAFKASIQVFTFCFHDLVFCVISRRRSGQLRPVGSPERQRNG